LAGKLQIFERPARKLAPTSCRRESISFDSVYQRDSPKLYEIKSTALTRIQVASVGWSAPHLLRERGASQPRPLAQENLSASFLLPERLSRAVEIKSTTLTRIQEAAVGWSSP
jgi:hypothetical protein